MANYKQLPPINEPIPGEYRPRDQEPTDTAFSSTNSATVLPPISSIHTQPCSPQRSLISKPAKDGNQLGVVFWLLLLLLQPLYHMKTNNV